MQYRKLNPVFRADLEAWDGWRWEVVGSLEWGERMKLVGRLGIAVSLNWKS